MATRLRLLIVNRHMISSSTFMLSWVMRPMSKFVFGIHANGQQFCPTPQKHHSISDYANYQMPSSRRNCLSQHWQWDNHCHPTYVTQDLFACASPLQILWVGISLSDRNLMWLDEVLWPRFGLGTLPQPMLSIAWDPLQWSTRTPVLHGYQTRLRGPCLRWKVHTNQRFIWSGIRVLASMI